jgi:hypothetical protein
MRARIWIFTAVVALALALNLARISLSVAQMGEDTMRARVAAASTALRGQIDLLDARLAPRAVAMMPDLIEAVRGEDRQPPGRPDERALRAAGSVLTPEPDVFGVVTAQGAIVSRRGRPVQTFDDPNQLPLSQTAGGALPQPTFATFDNAVYRFAAARVPGAAAAAVVGTLVDDRFASQLKSQVDADVTLLQAGRILASSLPQGEERTRLLRWAAAPAAGYGVLPIRLPLVGTALSGELPRGTARYAVRAALIPLDGGVQAALTVPAAPYLSWLGRYQAFYLLGLALLVVLGFVWGLLARVAEPVVQHVIPVAPQPPAEPEDGVVSPPRRAPRTPSLIGADIGEPRPDAPPTRDVPWSHGEGPSGEHKLVVEPARAPMAQAAETPPAPPENALAPEMTAEAAKPEEQAADWEKPAQEEAAAAPGEAAAPEWAKPALADEAASTSPEWQGLAAALGDSFPPEQGEAPGPEMRQISDPLSAPPEEAAPAGEAGPDANVTLQDLSVPGMEESDPDELHWRETYDAFRELKLQLGEPADRLSFEKFAAKLKRNRADLLAKHRCKGVRFSVYEKDGRAAIKASAIR